MDRIIEKIRSLIEDILITNGKDSFDYNFILQSKIFTLSESNLVSSSLKVYKNGILWTNNNYSFNPDNCKLTIIGTLQVGDNLESTFNYYEKYSDNELKGYIRAALAYISAEKYKTFVTKPVDLIFPTPTEDEEYLIALIASILIKGDVRSYRTPEFTVTFNDNDSKEKRIKKLVRQYKSIYGYTSYIDLASNVEIEE